MRLRKRSPSHGSGATHGTGPSPHAASEPPSHEGGFGTIEWVGIAVICSVIIAGIVKMPWAPELKAGAQSFSCVITNGNEGCGRPTGSFDEKPKPGEDAYDPPEAEGDRQDIIERAMFWVEQPVPYSMEAYTAGPDGGSWRTDCSGFVSMAWDLDQNHSTVTLPQVAHIIPKDDLQPGDILLKGGAETEGAAGHVAIFNGWTDETKTSYYGIEQAGGVGTVTRVISYPYDQDSSYVPYRKNGL